MGVPGLKREGTVADVVMYRVGGEVAVTSFSGDIWYSSCVRHVSCTNLMKYRLTSSMESKRLVMLAVEIIVGCGSVMMDGFNI